MQKLLLVFSVILISIGMQVQAQNPFGTGSDGSLTVAAGETVIINQALASISNYTPSGSNFLSVSSTDGFNQGDEVLVIIMQDAEPDSTLNLAGIYEFKRIIYTTNDALYFSSPLENSYSGTGGIKSQVVRVHHFTDLSVHGVLTAVAWDGNAGGILSFRVKDNFLISATGIVEMNGKGFRGKNRQADNTDGVQGEGIFGFGAASILSNYTGGGGGQGYYSGGGGGGHAFTGNSGGGTDIPGVGGRAVGDSTLNRIYFGGGGGTGSDNDSNNGPNPNSGFGGGIIFVSGNIFSNSGLIRSNGTNGFGGGGSNDGGSGGGAGGSIYCSFYQVQQNGIVQANGGLGFMNTYPGGHGSLGRIRIDSRIYSGTGSENPAAFEGNFSGLFHTPLLNTSQTIGNYDLTAYVVDAQSDPITSFKLFYTTGTGGFQEVNMSLSSGFSYNGSIPAQAFGTNISYYLWASDGDDEYYFPINAPTQTVTFQVSGLPVDNLNLTDNNQGGVILSWEEPLNSIGLSQYNVYRSEIPGFIPGSSNLIATTTDTLWLDNTVQDFHTYYYLVGADYSSNIAFSPILSILVNNLNQTTILGYCYLEGASNHVNIKVKFHPISPSAVLDSTYTNALGYFETQINPGIYDVSFEKAGYQSYYRLENTSIIVDMDLEENTILALGNTNISGNVSGIWDGLYTIGGNITIPLGDSLTILAGSEIRFLGNYNVYVYGYLFVDGNETDSILFTSSPHNQLYAAGQWQGIDFYASSDNNSHINYAIIRYAVDGVYYLNASSTISNSRIFSCTDKGLELNGNLSNPTISNVQVHHCYDGIYNYDGQPEISFFQSTQNTRYGLYWDYYANGNISNSSFTNNASHGMYLFNNCHPIIDSCHIANNSSWGVRVDAYSNPTFLNTYVGYNTGYGFGLYVDGYSWHTPKVENCVVEYNTSWGMYINYYVTPASIIRNNLIQFNGGGIYLGYAVSPEISHNRIIGNNNNAIHFHSTHYSHPYIHHNLLAHNNGHGIYKNSNNSDPVFTFNTIVANAGDGFVNNQVSNSSTFLHNIVSNNNGMGVRSNVLIKKFEYNNIFSNGLGEISNVSNLPIDTWDFVSFNAQADTADIYLNISADPLFAYEIDSLDFRLNLNSSCINVGDPSLPDPDGSTADLGAYYYDLGNPHEVSYVESGDASISIAWQAVELDSLVSYKVYYKKASESTYTFATNTSNEFAQVNSLLNDTLYDLVVTSQFSSYESPYSKKLSARPGIPNVSFTPAAFHVSVLSDTVPHSWVVSNTGSTKLFLDLPAGIPAGASYFNGSNSYVRYTDPAQMELMTAFTIETWIRREANGHFEFFSKHFQQYSLFVNSSNYLGLYKGYTSEFYQTITSNYQLPQGEWHHIAISWTGTTLKFYADGILVDTKTDIRPDPIPNLGNYFVLGCRANSWNQYFNGYLAETRMWNIVRSDEEIFRYMNSPLLGNEQGLVAYFPLRNNYNDQSSFSITPQHISAMQLTNMQVSPFEFIPQILPDGEFYQLNPGSSLTIPFLYYPTGQSGTFIYRQPVYTNIGGNEFFEIDIAVSYGESVPSTPVHFDAVIPTANSYPIIITEAEIDEVNLAVGDEIGVYDGNLCVGAAIFDGTFNFVLTVYQEDISQGLNGYVSGNLMSFVIYDASADLEATVDAVYQVGDGTFGFAEFTVCRLQSTVFEIQAVPLSGNMFNLISFNKLPRYSNSGVIFNTINDLQIVYNDQGNAYIPPYSINTLGDIYFKDGFHLYTQTDDTIYFEGTRINPFNYPITVESGKWNSIAYLGEIPLTVSTAIESNLVDSIEIVQTSDGGAWIPSLGINTLGTFVPGKGYQLALSSNSNIQITYQLSNTETGKFDISRPAPNYFSYSATGLPYQIVMEMLDSEKMGINSGDEIAVFDGEQCVGAIVYMGEDRLLLTAWSSEDNLGLKGYKTGSLMQFKAYTAAGELELLAVGMNKNDNFSFNGSYFAHIRFETTLESLNLAAYPNPFRDEVSIRLYLPEASPVTLVITDISGKQLQLMCQDKLEAGEYLYRWNGQAAGIGFVPAGVYLIELISNDRVETKKLIRY